MVAPQNFVGALKNWNFLNNYMIYSPLSSVSKVAVVEMMMMIIIIINFTVSIFVSNLLNVSCCTSILLVIILSVTLISNDLNFRYL